MDIFWRLVLAHLLADFTFQTDFIAAWKRKDVFGGIVHSLIFFICAAALCYQDINTAWFRFSFSDIKGYEALFLLSASHFLVDMWRARAIVKKKSSDSLMFFLLDQFLHFLLIFIFIPYSIVRPAEKFVYILIGLVIVTHFSTIFIYFLEKELSGRKEISNTDKYHSMAERLLIGSSVLIPGFAGLLVPGLWIAASITGKKLIKRNFSWVNIVAGSTLALIAGVVVRTLIYA